VKTEQVKSGADFTIVSPAKPGSKIPTMQQSGQAAINSTNTTLPTIPANMPVTLNQYNIKAYPDRLLEVSAYGDGSADIAYESKVKILGIQGYIGPVVKYEKRDSVNKVTVGARVTVPI
jgi:hypothetical protein